MYVLVRASDSSVVAVSDTFENHQYGYKLGNDIFPSRDDFAYYEVPSVPDVDMREYCYQSNKGFYKNPDLMTYIPMDEKVERMLLAIDTLKSQNATLMLKLAKNGIK